MATDANSRIALAVHPLKGSTPPGADTYNRLRSSHEAKPRLSDVDEQHSAVMRLAKLHGLDAEVIELAERTEALALRETRLWERRADIDDAVDKAMPPKPVLPTMQNTMTSTETVVDGVRTLTVTEPPGWAAEHRAISAAHEAALAEHNRIEAEVGQRLGLPMADKLCCRASARLYRWGRRLAAMPPRTYAGLRAKAAVLRATVQDGQLYDTWRQTLAASIGADAIRLIEAEAEERFREDQARDGELFSLIARHGPAMKVWDDADETSNPICMAWWEARPPMPEALRYRIEDWPFRATGRDSVAGSSAVVMVYDERDIATLRSAPAPVSKVEHREPAPWNSDECIVRIERFPDSVKIARKAEIIGAWDSWQADIERLRETMGLNAANAAVERAAERCNAIEDAILDYLPRTFEGLQAKARWIAAGFIPNERAQHVLRDLCRMPPIALAPPAQVTPTRDEVEAYRTFLDMEFRFLNWETHGTAGASGGIWLDNPAGRLHGNDQPPPSSRAVTVLTALGLMPNSSAEDKRDAETRAA